LGWAREVGEAGRQQLAIRRKRIWRGQGHRNVERWRRGPGLGGEVSFIEWCICSIYGVKKEAGDESGRFLGGS